MKYYLYTIAILILLITAGFWVFFNHGYNYTLPVTQTTVQKTAYHYSEACDAKQQQLQALIAPLEAQEAPLANHLIHGPFPIDNGEQLYQQYAALRDQINALETKYFC